VPAPQEELTAQQARAAEEANAANAERVADLESQLEALGSQLAEESRAREALQAQLDGLGSEATQVCVALHGGMPHHQQKLTRDMEFSSLAVPLLTPALALRLQ
jgi:chromosome segregation ATPase